MRKTGGTIQIRILGLVLLAGLLLGVLSSCSGGLSGRYESVVAGNGVRYEFKGSKVTVEVYAGGQVMSTVRGTYSIEGNKITITPDKNGGDAAGEYTGTFDYKQDGDTITIGRIVLKKA